jgi:hypothetical protein
MTMRVRVWSVRGGRAKEHPIWRDLDQHARELEAVARAIRHDVAHRDASTASRALNHLIRQSQHAYDQVSELLAEPAPAPLIKPSAVEL